MINYTYIIKDKNPIIVQPKFVIWLEFKMELYSLNPNMKINIIDNHNISSQIIYLITSFWSSKGLLYNKNKDKIRFKIEIRLIYKQGVLYRNNKKCHESSLFNN